MKGKLLENLFLDYCYTIIGVENHDLNVYFQDKRLFIYFFFKFKNNLTFEGIERKVRRSLLNINQSARNF